MRLSRVTLLVSDYDQAIAYYVGVLGFRLEEDIAMGAAKRWVVVSPGDEGSARFVLARAANAVQSARIGGQAGGRVGFFLDTGDFDRDYETFVARGVKFIEAPRVEAYGKVAVFEDLYGNKWDLVQPSRQSGA